MLISDICAGSRFVRTVIASMPFLADLERRLTEEGRYAEFKQKFEEEYGSSWESSRQDFDFIQDTIVDVLEAMGFMSEQAARNWCEKAAEPYRISIEDFAKRVKAYSDRKGNNHHVVFLVDEVGQYIGDDSKLMLNMGTDINLVALKIAHLNELGYGFRNVDHRSDFLR